VRGWSVAHKDGRPRWTVQLPEARAGAWRFAQLFVNGQRRFRPVLPAAGWHTIAAEVAPSAANAGKGHDRFACVANDLEPEWSNLGDVEVVVTHLWSMSRLPIAAIEPNPADPATRIASLAGRTASPAFWSTLPKGNRFLVENVREALGEPGSWYLDRPTGALTYCPRDGEAPGGVGTSGQGGADDGDLGVGHRVPRGEIEHRTGDSSGCRRGCGLTSGGRGRRRGRLGRGDGG
jgi:hypothetical protein